MPITGLSTGNLDSRFNSAVTKLEKAWEKLGFTMFEKTLIDELALVAANDRSALLQWGMLIDGSSYKLVPLNAETKYSENPPRIIAEAGYKRMDLWAIEWSKLADDLSRETIVASMPEMAGKPNAAIVLEAMKLLATGETATCKYDGKAFFHAQHLIDPFKPDTAANRFPNLITQPLTSDGYNAVANTIRQRPDPGSDKASGTLYLPNRSLSGRNMTILCGDDKTASELNKIFDPASIYNPGLNLASETRRTYTQATVQLVPEMAADAAFTGNYCYVLVKTNPTLRPLFVRIPHKPKVDKSQAGSDAEIDRKLTRANGYCTHGQDFGAPHALYKWKFA